MGVDIPLYLTDHLYAVAVGVDVLVELLGVGCAAVEERLVIDVVLGLDARLIVDALHVLGRHRRKSCHGESGQNSQFEHFQVGMPLEDESLLELDDDPVIDRVFRDLVVRLEGDQVVQLSRHSR
ncbi:hypothetical protein D9M70_591460 [compost metagenome]